MTTAIDWDEHCEVWQAYAKRYRYSSEQQNATCIAERGGFGYQEATRLLGHEPVTWVANVVE